jgi:hypothetical protein
MAAHFKNQLAEVKSGVIGALASAPSAAPSNIPSEPSEDDDLFGGAFSGELFLGMEHRIWKAFCFVLKPIL